MSEFLTRLIDRASAAPRPTRVYIRVTEPPPEMGTEDVTATDVLSAFDQLIMAPGDPGVQFATAARLLQGLLYGQMGSCPINYHRFDAAVTSLEELVASIRVIGTVSHARRARVIRKMHMAAERALSAVLTALNDAGNNERVEWGFRDFTIELEDLSKKITGQPRNPAWQMGGLISATRTHPLARKAGLGQDHDHTATGDEQQ